MRQRKNKFGKMKYDQCVSYMIYTIMVLGHDLQ